jgi:hypothetical protein
MNEPKVEPESYLAIIIFYINAFGIQRNELKALLKELTEKTLISDLDCSDLRLIAHFFDLRLKQLRLIADITWDMGFNGFGDDRFIAFASFVTDYPYPATMPIMEMHHLIEELVKWSETKHQRERTPRHTPTPPKPDNKAQA